MVRLLVAMKLLAFQLLLSPALVGAFSTLGSPKTCSAVRAFSRIPRLESAVSASVDSPVLKLNNDGGDSPEPPLASLPLPPRKGGFLRRFRDTFAHIKDPEAFIAERSEELGPVFFMYQFFKPVVVVGGQEAVREFVEVKEKAAKVIQPDLPPAFTELHTKWSALNMDSTQEEFAEARGLFKGLLQAPEARAMYVKTILPQIEAYVDSVVERATANPEQELFLVPEVKELCLQIFSGIFSGEGLTKEQVQMFYDYNDALLSLSQQSKQYTRGIECRDNLTAEMLRRFQNMEENAAKSNGDASPAQYIYDVFKNQKGFLDVGNYERVSIAMLLMVWGAYVECASLMVGSAVSMVEQKIDPTSTILKEVRNAEERSTDDRGLKRTELAFWDRLKYSKGILRETLRLDPPGSGVQRYGDVEFSLAGYRIPAKLSVQMDPRIGNLDPNLFEEPQSFEPLRWVPESSSAATSSSSGCPFQGTAQKLGVGSWFPGGNGAHRCPGVPLAELISTMFLVSLSERFESWEFGGSGLTKDGAVDYVKIPIKICPDDLGLTFRPR